MIGLKILKRRRAVPAELAARFIGLPVANVSDCMSRLFAGGARLRPMHNGRPMSGPALTVRTRPGDNLMVHKAIDMAAPGDVIVVDAGGPQRNAIIGEIMSTLAASRKIAGMVIDGPIRDVDSISKNKFPVFARSISHRGPYKEGPGEINVTVSIDGMVVHPGDIIVGDDDGLFAIRPEGADALAKLASILVTEKQRGRSPVDRLVQLLRERASPIAPTLFL